MSSEKHIDQKEEQDDRPKVTPDKRTFWQNIVSHTRLSSSYTISDISSRPRNFCIGFWSVFTVVFFVGLILLALSKTPVVFLRFAELTTGEMDVLVLAEGDLPFINYTDVQPKIDSASSIDGSTPRWLLKGEIYNYLATSGGVTLNATNSSNNTTTGTTGSGDPREDLPPMSVNIIIVDSEKEMEIGLGRTWPYRQIGYGEVQVYSSALRFIQTRANIGQRLRLKIDIAGILAQQNVAFDLLGATNTTAGDAFGGNPFGNLTEGTIVPVTIGGVTVNVTVPNVDAALALPLTAAALDSSAISGLLTPELQLVTADAIEQTYAKYPAALGNVAILDYHDLLNLLLNQLCYESLRNPFASVVGTQIASPTAALLPSQADLQAQFPLEQYALVTVAMFSNRFEMYYMGRRPRQREVIKKSDALFFALGVDYAGSVQYVVMAALSGFYFFELFLGSLFQSVVAVIAVLGAILVYTLLLTNSQERSFEMALMRSQGMYRSQLAHLMITQSVVFIIPAVTVAMLTLVLVNIALELGIATFSAAPAELFRISIEAIIVPILFGVIVPMMANYGPTKSALFSSLRDALDVYRQTANETSVSAVKLAELGLEPWQTMLGWFLVIIGFMVYYLIPFSFIFDELWLFFLILNIILLGMLFGLCLISYAFEGFVERSVLWLMLWGKEKRLSTLILRNLGSHKERNSKAYIMFTTSVACIIFAGVLFSLLSNSISQSVESAIGADIVVQSLTSDFPLNRSVIESFLRENRDLVESFSFATFTLATYPQITQGVTLSNFIGFPQRRHSIVGIDETLLDSVYSKFYLYTDLDSEYQYQPNYRGDPDAVRSMYTNPPQTNLNAASAAFTGYPNNQTIPDVEAKYNKVIPCIMAEAAREVLGLSAGSSGTVAFSYATGATSEDLLERETVFLVQPRVMVEKMPGWPAISSLQFLLNSATILIPIQDFQMLLEPNKVDYPQNFNSPRYTLPSDAIPEVMYQRVFIRVNANLKGAERTDFVNLLQSKVNPYYHIPIDTQDIVKQLQTTSDMIIYFFFFIAVVTVILDTFMLWLTFVSNVKLNAWGFAVLRSLGFTVPQLIRSYIYEALCIVLSSFFVGTIVGVLIALTLILQMNLFLQLPFTFDFPVPLFFFLLGLSLVSAVLGSWLPTRSITRRSISSVLKSGD